MIRLASITPATTTRRSRILPVFAVGSIPLAGWAAADVAGGARPTWATVGLLAGLGIVIYVPASVLQHRILLARGPSYSALLGLAVPPVVGASSVALHLSGPPSPAEVAGTIATILGMTFVVRQGHRFLVPRTGNMDPADEEVADCTKGTTS
ncbi:hypothetical protein GCM10025867_36250 [Frondihabitans sucicola]|uniref:EamA domain-containing protein n=1 Tax=Frondihabitans sucicola TaxID=1268041 RepID=A0ABN6Y2U3_9MICO|nr:hypothetical protein GCM10025867_36250 [Frondihabitans sucicola]